MSTIHDRLPPGTRVRVEMTKWVDRPHWAFDARYLGADEHGDWLGMPVGTSMSRPGMALETVADQVGLVPPAEAGGGAGWLATFHRPGYDVRTYVDMTTVPTWDGTTVHAVDLDLDVVLPAEGELYVDDEDEFDEHRLAYGYPDDVVRLARTSCAWVFEAVRDSHPPFDGVAGSWLARLDELPTLDQ